MQVIILVTQLLDIYKWLKQIMTRSADVTICRFLLGTLRCRLRLRLSKLVSPSKGCSTSAITKLIVKLKPWQRRCTVLMPKVCMAMPFAVLSCSLFTVATLGVRSKAPWCHRKFGTCVDQDPPRSLWRSFLRSYS